MEEIIDNVTSTWGQKVLDVQFPVHFVFHIGTMSNDFTAHDERNNTLAYVRQKMFKFKEDVIVFSDDTRSKELFRIRADRWIDFNANYSIFDASGTFTGSVGRKGMRSLWKANYGIFDADKNKEYDISEENPWAKVGDTLLGEVPVLSFFTGYLFNPKYLVKDLNGRPVARLSKVSSLFGRKFMLEQLETIPNEDIERMILSLMMMILLERRRG
ncbi:MAG: hypothetical protein V4638_11325 [Bacteroidota bacterium]